jgi:sigma-B regulation protein RsbU (phosphoserine phosphatase)
MKLAGPFTGQLKGSSLNEIVRRRLPRIINDLEAYLAEKPDSVPTQKLVAEGMRSSLTCPLIVDEKPVGFMFFTSVERHTYTNVHVGFFQQIAAQLSTIVEKGHLYTELDAQKDVIQRQNDLLVREMEMARQVQRALMPEDAPEVAGLDIAFIYEPAIQVGGDILDVIRQADGRTVLFVGDAMGHGVSAALIMSVVKAALQSAADTETDPGKILNRVNGALARLLDFQFVTAACCVIDAPERLAEVALAGHSPPVHFNARGEELLEDDEGGDMPLGIRRDVEYDTDRIALEPGDMLVFFTDGVFEAENASEEQYGMTRLCEQVRVNGSSTSRQVLEAIRRDVKAHCGDRRMNDDLTLLAVKMTSE